VVIGALNVWTGKGVERFCTLAERWLCIFANAGQEVHRPEEPPQKCACAIATASDVCIATDTANVIPRFTQEERES
jgi:hypothetical protein